MNELVPTFRRSVSIARVNRTEQAKQMRELKEHLSAAQEKEEAESEGRPFSLAERAAMERKYVDLLYEGARRIIPSLPAVYEY